ncbi:TetR/AcrR family transcriptional regulator C-terminal domain-containing protein [Isoptericola sp. NPDC057653]|uniref:TetR/AcrR family transcriptional regulator C-terminal domain-containing protein n=1 Tax=unclassified Isoptericola TaxID=2623355 RepID=UPI0036A362C7
MPPRPPLLDRRAIVAATLEVLDERGLDGLSLHAVAARLGVRQPALYHHFRNKAEVLAAAAAEVLDRWHTERLPEPDEDWRAFLARNAHSLRRAMLAVRDGARLVASTGPRAPNPANALAQVELLERHGFAGVDAVLAYIAVSRYTIGATLEEQATPDRTAIVPGQDLPAGADRLARLGAQVAAIGADREFAAGLDALVAGLAPTAGAGGNTRPPDVVAPTGTSASRP